MTLEDIENLAREKLTETLKLVPFGNMFEVKKSSSLTGPDDLEHGIATIEVGISFEFGNVNRDFTVLYGWNDGDHGIEYGEDGDTDPATPLRLMSEFFFNVALEGLNDKYCH